MGRQDICDYAQCRGNEIVVPAIICFQLKVQRMKPPRFESQACAATPRSPVGQINRSQDKSTFELHSKVSGLEGDANGIISVLRAVFDQSHDAVCITSDDHILFANTSFAAFFGVTQRDSLAGRSIYSLLEQSLHAALREQAQRALAGHVARELVHQQVNPSDGSTRVLKWVASALPELGKGVLQRVLSDVTEQTRERLAWERSRRELQRLSANQVDAREAERRHIAREMHDELGQRLTALKLELASLARQRHQDSDARISAMLSMVDETVASVRRIASDLRPMMLDDLGLNPAIEWLARESAQRMNIKVSVMLEEPVLPNEHQLVIAIYRIVQEALTNVARHANATLVRIETKREGDELRVVVSDNGRGFSAQAMEHDNSHGLIGIRERTLSLGGHFEMGNLPTGGARIAIRLPLQLTNGRPKILTERRCQKPITDGDVGEAPVPRKRSAVEFAFNRAVELLHSNPVKV
jgi:two-component system, NarL family, sensor histidine kinase UhpB